MAKMEERPPPVIDYAKPLFKPCHVPHQRVLSPLPSHPFSLTPLAQKIRVYTWTSPFGFSFAGHMDPCPFSLPENAREFYFCQRLTLELRNGGGGGPSFSTRLVRILHYCKTFLLVGILQQRSYFLAWENIKQLLSKVHGNRTSFGFAHFHTIHD